MTEMQTLLSEVETRDTQKVAALDIGSNSFHLVVARIVAGSVQIVHSVKQKVRLVEGLIDGKLTEEAIERGLATMQVISESLKGFEPDSVRIVATHTLRRASNARQFILRALKILPYPVEVISGVEEARLIYSGVAHTSHFDGKRLVVDIGGGSTEFIIGQDFDTRLCRSLQMGCVSYTTRFFNNGELSAKQFDKAITAAQQELELIEDKYKQLGWDCSIGTSGTIKCIFNLCQPNTERENPVTLAQLDHLMKACINAKTIDKLNFEGMTEQRRPVLAAGLSILIGIFRSFGVESIHYSSAALREGVLYQMSDSLGQNDVRSRTAQSLATRYDVDIEQAKRVHTLSMTLFELCKHNWALTNANFKNMLGWASLLHEIGLQINSRGLQRHGAYILQNIDMPGFNQEEQLLLATLVRCQRKRIRKEDIPEFDQYKQTSVIRLIALIRLSVLLNIKRQSDILPELEVSALDSELAIKFAGDWLLNKPVFEADLAREGDYLKAIDIAFSYA